MTKATNVVLWEAVPPSQRWTPELMQATYGNPNALRLDPDCEVAVEHSWNGRANGQYYYLALYAACAARPVGNDRRCSMHRGKATSPARLPLWSERGAIAELLNPALAIARQERARRAKERAKERRQLRNRTDNARAFVDGCAYLLGVLTAIRDKLVPQQRRAVFVGLDFWQWETQSAEAR